MQHTHVHQENVTRSTRHLDESDTQLLEIALQVHGFSQQIAERSAGRRPTSVDPMRPGQRQRGTSAGCYIVDEKKCLDTRQPILRLSCKVHMPVQTLQRPGALAGRGQEQLGVLDRGRRPPN